MLLVSIQFGGCFYTGALRVEDKQSYWGYLKANCTAETPKTVLSCCNIYGLCVESRQHYEFTITAVRREYIYGKRFSVQKGIGCIKSFLSHPQTLVSFVFLLLFPCLWDLRYFDSQLIFLTSLASSDATTEQQQRQGGEHRSLASAALPWLNSRRGIRCSTALWLTLSVWIMPRWCSQETEQKVVVGDNPLRNTKEREGCSAPICWHIASRMDWWKFWVCGSYDLWHFTCLSENTTIRFTWKVEKIETDLVWINFWLEFGFDTAFQTVCWLLATIFETYSWRQKEISGLIWWISSSWLNLGLTGTQISVSLANSSTDACLIAGTHTNFLFLCFKRKLIITSLCFPEGKAAVSYYI